MNSTYNNTFQNAAFKVFAQLGQLIEEDEKQNKTKNNNKKTIKPKQINVLDSSTDILKDDEPKPFNLLDLDNDILNIIGDFVKKDNEEREHKELIDKEQIINGKKIEFRNFCGFDIRIPLNTKESIKKYIFDYMNTEYPDIKTYASNARIRLSNDDKRKCFWILFKRCKFIFEGNKVCHNKVIYNMDDDEEKEIFMKYLKLKS